LQSSDLSRSSQTPRGAFRGWQKPLNPSRRDCDGALKALSNLSGDLGKSIAPWR
jgi:hypothetical protein